MRDANERAITCGLAVALCSGLLALAYSVLRFLIDPWMFDAAKTSGAGVFTTSPLWGPTWALCIGSMVLAVPGGLAVYGYFAASRVEPLARIGFIASTIDVILWMPFVSFMGFTGAVAARFPQAAPLLCATVSEGYGALVILFAMLAQISGYACLGVAMWRTTTLPKWTGAGKLLAGLLFALPWIFPGAEIVAGALGIAVPARILCAVRRGEFPEYRTTAANGSRPDIASQPGQAGYLGTRRTVSGS